MKILRFLFKNKVWWGIVEGDYVQKITPSPFEKFKRIGKKLSLEDVKILPPSNPSKIILVGLNFKDHAQELNLPLPSHPIIFLKPPSSIVGHKDFIICPPKIGRIDYEAELAFVIKRRAKNISSEEAHKFILGYTCLNDITARTIQKTEVQWTRAKSFDTFCPLGPWIETEIDDPMNLCIRLYVNGKLRQNSSTSKLIFSPFKLLEFISKVMTLYPGDVISCGTPPGVGPLKDRDKVCVEIEKIGTLCNTVKKV